MKTLCGNPFQTFNFPNAQRHYNKYKKDKFLKFKKLHPVLLPKADQWEEAEGWGRAEDDMQELPGVPSFQLWLWAGFCIGLRRRGHDLYMGAGEGEGALWRQVEGWKGWATESIEWFREDQASSPSYDLAPPSPPPPPTHRRENILLTREGVGVGAERNQIIRRRECLVNGHP